MFLIGIDLIKLTKMIFSNLKDAFEWQQGKKYCATADPYKTDTGARGRMWYPHSEEEQKRVGRWLVAKVTASSIGFFDQKCDFIQFYGKFGQKSRNFRAGINVRVFSD